MEQFKNFFLKKTVIAAAIIISGFCWYLSCGLSGNFWYLLWLAPIPVLIISFNATGKMAFIISFVAYLIGRLSWFSYLVTVATLIPAIIFTLALPLAFALIMIITRRTVIKTNSWYAIFAFPVFFTTFEFLLITFSPDGTAGSIAYSQANFFPLIQIASVTGILGITFFVSFIPSAIAVGWYYRREKSKLHYITGVVIGLIITVLLFGIIRINSGSEKSTIKVGLAVLEEKFHYFTEQPDLQKEIQTAEYYAHQITQLSRQGAQVVVLPERAMNVSKETVSAVMRILMDVARQNHVTVVTGYTNFKQVPERNSALVIDADGNLITDYNKVHLVTGFEYQFTPGKEIGLFKLSGMQMGTAICKDLDFPNYIRKYGTANANILYIPALDFVMDDWLHSRMAVLRDVENGFSEVRTARQGRLTISDCYGRVTYEANSSNGRGVTLLGNVLLQKRNTIYTRFGDWFGIVNLIAATFFIFFAGKKLK